MPNSCRAVRSSWFVVCASICDDPGAAEELVVKFLIYDADK